MPASVGLLTGDTSLNGEAPVVVMTTEVLRNMLYAGSSTLSGLAYVVMDEVHYLADRFRGPVWEEVIIHLPAHVQLASLSATVSNAEEFGAWLDTVRGDTRVVVSEHRPVPLWQHVVTGTEGAGGARLLDLFVEDEAGRGVVNPELRRLQREVVPFRGRDQRHRGRPHGRGGDRGGMPGRDRSGDRGGDRGGDRQVIAGSGTIAASAAPRARRSSSGWTPRACCRRSPSSSAAPGATPPSVSAWCPACGSPPARSARRSAGSSSAGSGRSRIATWPRSATRSGPRACSAGLAAHHAGMLPAFKEVVEELFVRGLVKAVFATETLALGINMPARTVVLEKLVKFNGEAHVPVTPGEYTQLTGRAGRRGIDIEGHAVVVWDASLDAEQVGGLASTRTYPLRSSFRPTYNMAVNLVAQVGRDAAREILETSFAQFQADRGVVGLARQVREQDEALAGYREQVVCHLGDVDEYLGLRRRISALEKDTSRESARRQRARALASLETLRTGDVILVPTGRRSGYAVVIDPGTAGGLDGPRPSVVGLDRQVRRLALHDVPHEVRPVTTVRVPRNFNVRNPRRGATSPRRCATR